MQTKNKLETQIKRALGLCDHFLFPRFFNDRVNPTYLILTFAIFLYNRFCLRNICGSGATCVGCVVLG